MTPLVALALSLVPLTAHAQPVTRGDAEATAAAREALEAALPVDRGTTDAFLFVSGDERVVLFAEDFDGEQPQPCPEAYMPGDDCEEPPPPSAPGAGLARLVDGGVEMILPPRPFLRFDWELADTDGDGEDELTVVVDLDPMAARIDFDQEFWVIGPVDGQMARRANIPLAGGRRTCGHPGYRAVDPPEPVADGDGRAIRVKYVRETETANCQQFGAELLCDCEERSMVVLFALREDGTLVGLPPWRRNAGPFVRYRVQSNDGQ